MIKFIHTADIHLDSPLKGLEAHEGAPVEEIRGATRKAFDNMIELAIEEKIDFVLIAGDLYDGDWKDYNTGLFFADRMGRLSRAGIRVFIVSGNHDAASQITRAMPLPENVTFLSTKKPESVKLDDLGVIIHGQGYSKRAVTDNLASRYPQYVPGYFNIGMLHTSLTGRTGHENYAPCSIDELKSKGYDYWALGHVHKQEIVDKDPWIVFPGNIQGRHIRETGAKGATLVTVDNGTITGVTEKELDVVRWAVCEVDMSQCHTMDDVNDAVRLELEQELEKTEGRTLAVRLILTNKSYVHAQLINRTAQLTGEFKGIAVGTGDIWIEKIKFHTSRQKSLEEIFPPDTPIAGLLQSIQHLELNKETIMDLVPELSALKKKLPPEIFNNPEMLNHNESFPGQFFDLFIDDFDPSMDHIDMLRNEVQELLIVRLLQHGDDR